MDEPAASPPSPGPALPHADDLPLDPSLIKVLASDSRRDILRLLKTRRMTLTEMAAALDLKKATVLEHLKRLTDAGLIRRIDDERMWVYYELTRQGGRVVNPGRTRFYLIMASAAAAAVLVASLVAFALLNGTGAPPSSPLHVTFEQSSAPSDGALSVQIQLDAADASRAKAYLVSEADAQTLRDDDGAVPGIPLTLAESHGNIARFQALSPVPAGTYYVYVVDTDGRSNRDSLAAVRVPSLEVQAPETLWRGLDESVTLHVARDGRPASGTLLLAAAEGVLPTLPLENGTATLNASVIDALTAPSYVLQYLPTGTHVWLTLEREIAVRDPVLAVTPAILLENAPSTLQVHFAPDAPHAARHLQVRIENENVTTTLDDGAEARFRHHAGAAGVTSIHVGRTAALDLWVVPDVQLNLTLDNGTYAARLAHANRSPISGALLQVDGATVGTSDDDGTVRFAAPGLGEHALRIVADGTPVRIIDRAYLFASDGAREAPARLSVSNVSAAHDGRTLVATFTMTSRSIVAQAATLALVVDGQTFASGPVTLAPDERREGKLTASAPLGVGDHAVRVDLLPARGNAMSNDHDTTKANAPASAVNWTTTGSVGGIADDRDDDRFTLNVRPSIPALAAPAASPTTTGHADAAASARDTPAAGLLVAVAAVALAAAWRRRPQGRDRK